MNQLIILTTLVYAVSAASNWTAPWFCHDLACPKFTVLNNDTSKYEVRQYEPSVWVSTMLSDVSMDSDLISGLFNKLYQYIIGANSESLHLAMTAPVIDEIDILANGRFNITRSFMVPYAHQPNPPTPTDNTVFIKRYPAMKVFVESFPGLDIATHRPAKIAELKAAINDISLYDSDRLFSAGYDSPFSILNRHNEVWLIAN